MRLRASFVQLSRRSLCSQLLFLGKIALGFSGQVVRDAVFFTDTFDFVRIQNRRQGRPKLNWVDSIMRVCIDLCGRVDSTLPQLLEHGLVRWREHVRAYCF